MKVNLRLPKASWVFVMVGWGGVLVEPNFSIEVVLCGVVIGGGGGVLNLRLKLGNNKFMDQKLYKFQIKVGYQ